MNTSNTGLATRPFVRGVVASTCPETKEILSIGRLHGWEFVVMGQASMPTEPVRVGDWLLIPAKQDTSPIPARALRRIAALQAAGPSIKGFIVAHEAPLLLPAPPTSTAERLRMPLIPEETRIKFKKASAAAGSALMGLAVLTGTAILAVAAVAAAAALLVPLALVASVAMVDPILIAVTTDGYWIEIDRWDTEAVV